MKCTTCGHGAERHVEYERVYAEPCDVQGCGCRNFVARGDFKGFCWRVTGASVAWRLHPAWCSVWDRRVCDCAMTAAPASEPGSAGGWQRGEQW